MQQPRARGREPQRFCSKACAAVAGNVARGGVARYGRPRTWADLTEAARQRKRLRVRVRRLLAGATWDGVTDEAILERDGWRCGICGTRIGKSFKAPHPRSRSVDHIVPLSEGGDDTAANKRAAHLGCNVRRGNRGGNEQLALIG